MRDGSDVAGEPKPKRSKWKRLLNWCAGWLEDRNKWGHTRAELIVGYFWIIVVVGCLGTVIWWFGEWDRQDREEQCIGHYATVPCLERLLKEAKAKEQYQKQLEEIKNGEVR